MSVQNHTKRHSSGRLAEAEAGAMARVPKGNGEGRSRRNPLEPPGLVEPGSTKGPTAEQIRRRAYDIYVARGGVPGDPVADWLQAERELRGK